MKNSQEIKPKERKEAMAVAFLLATRNLKMKEIASILHIPPSKATRARELAEKQGWLKIVENVPANDRSEIEKLAYPEHETLYSYLNKLATENDGFLPENVHVVYSGGREKFEDPSKAENKRYEEFGYNCAGRLISLISGAQYVATAWGRTMEGVAKGVERFGPEHAQKPEFMPVCGEPLNSKVPGISSSQAAETFAQAFGTKSFSLRGVGVRIPKRLNANQAVIREYLRTCDHYNKIFGESDPLIRKVGAIITGLGDAKTSKGDPYYNETLAAEGEQSRLNQLAAGNLAGVWFPAGPKHEPAIKDLNTRWLGIQYSDLKECARIHRPGVIVCAIGIGKMAILKRAMGIISHVFLDHELADALVAEAKALSVAPKAPTSGQPEKRPKRVSLRSES